MQKVRGNKKIVFTVAFILVVLIVVGLFWARGVASIREQKEMWAEAYMESVAFFDTDYDKLPTDYYAWEEWNENVHNLPKLTDTDIIPDNRLGTLMNTRVGLGKVHVKDPGNKECRELFEKLIPYYEKAFIWEPGTSAEECLKRLKMMSDPDTMAEIESLSNQVRDLCERTEADTIYFVPSDSDLVVNS